MAKISLRMMHEKYNSKLQRGVVRVSHTGVNAIKAALVFVQSISQEPVIARSIVVSGSLKKVLPYLKGGN